MNAPSEVRRAEIIKRKRFVCRRLLRREESEIARREK